MVGRGLESLAQSLDGARVGRHAADEGHQLADLLALGDGAAVVAHHRVAQALEHFGRLIALLLGVDHVGLGEDRAAPGDGRGLAGALHDAAHILDVVQQAVGLLVHERPGAGGAVAVGAVVGDAHPARDLVGLQPDELGRLAAHLEDGGDVGVQRADGAGDGLELVLVGNVEDPADQAAAGAGGPHRGDAAFGQRWPRPAPEAPGRPRPGCP